MNEERKITELKIGVGCIICGETVELETYEALSIRANFKICNKCRATILYVRKQLEEAEVE